MKIDKEASKKLGIKVMRTSKTATAEQVQEKKQAKKSAESAEKEAKAEDALEADFTRRDE